MADIDEDPSIRVELDNTEADISDEVQDFRFLSSLSQISVPSPSLPRRGEKDFEQNGTKSQGATLTASRDAMETALSHSRTHHPKNHIIGLFDPEADTVMVENPSGLHFRTIGKQLRGLKLHLLPEEALYMVERGSLDLRWTNVKELDGLPMSLQAAYTYLLGSQGLTLERYTVYTGLKRSGYVVFRAPAWYSEDHSKSHPPPGKPPESLGIFAELYASLFASTQPFLPPHNGPVVQPGLYRSYSSIYHQLAIIPHHDPTFPSTAERNSASSSSIPSHLRICPSFTVWKPSHQDFRKTAPPPPDFHIAVVNAREDPFPDYEQLDELLQCVPYDPPSEGGQLYGRLRQGYRNVIIAIVDQGVISFVRVADAGFGMEKVWDRGKKGARGGGKRGGRDGGGGGNQGRGGGRGRGQGGRGRGR